MEEIFNTIFTACKALTWIKQISADEGQLDAVDAEGNAKPVALFPCLLIDAQQTTWEAGEQLNQYGDATIITRFAYRKQSDQSNLTSAKLFTDSLANLKRRIEIEKVITKAERVVGVHGALIRQTTERERRSDGIVVYRTTWGVSVRESLA